MVGGTIWALQGNQRLKPPVFRAPLRDKHILARRLFLCSLKHDITPTTSRALRPELSGFDTQSSFFVCLRKRAGKGLKYVSQHLLGHSPIDVLLRPSTLLTGSSLRDHHSKSNPHLLRVFFVARQMLSCPELPGQKSSKQSSGQCSNYMFSLRDKRSFPPTLRFEQGMPSQERFEASQGNVFGLLPR